MKKKDRNRQVVGAAWYSESEWAALRIAAPDPERFKETYEEWTAMAESALAEAKRTGQKVVKVPIVATEFLRWCKDNGLQGDASARARFAADSLQRGSRTLP